ncbi:hypothetical protein [Streptomyces capparidis]
MNTVNRRVSAACCPAAGADPVVFRMPQVAATPLVAASLPNAASAAALSPVASSTCICARSGSCPVSVTKSPRTPFSSDSSAIAPATATVMPATARAADSPPTWRRRVASCQDSGPPPSRRTTAPTSHGSTGTSPASTSTEPAASAQVSASVPLTTPSDLVSRIARPSAGAGSRHHSRRLRGPVPRTTPSGSTATPRSANRATPTAAAGTPSTTREVSTGSGETSAGKALTSYSVTEPANRRSTRKNPAPAATPSTAPSRVSPAAIRRAVGRSAPTRRIAASRRSRRSPPNRTAVPMNTATGISSTTQPTTISTISTARYGCPAPVMPKPVARTALPTPASMVSLPL